MILIKKNGRSWNISTNSKAQISVPNIKSCNLFNMPLLLLLVSFSFCLIFDTKPKLNCKEDNEKKTKIEIIIGIEKTTFVSSIWLKKSTISAPFDI